MKMEQRSRKIQYLAGICASLGFLQSGATLSWGSPAIPKFKSGEAGVTIAEDQISWVVSLLYLGCVFGCYIGQVMNERIGRKRTLVWCAVPGLIGAGITIFAKIPELLHVARILLGISTGIVFVASIIYTTEIADKEIRGQLGLTCGIANNFGCLLMYGIGPFVSYDVLNCILFSIPLVYGLLCLWIPESPYYLLKEGQYIEARKQFMILKGTKDEKWADEELSVIQAHVKKSMEDGGTMKELVTNIKYRKSMYIVIGLKIVQYMTGFAAIQPYLESLFKESTSISGAYVSIVYGLIQLVSSIVASFLARWVGRRAIMLTSCSGVAVAWTLVGTYFYLQDSVKISPETLSRISFLPFIGVIGYNVMYNSGMAFLCYVMQAELFPINVKTIASSSCTMAACILSFVVAKGYQNFKDLCGLYVVFWFFALVAYVGIVYIYIFMPETKGQTLEEVQDRMEGRNETQALRSAIQEDH